MMKNKHFDSVQMMREIRDRMSAEMSRLSPSERLSYVEKMSGIRRVAPERKTPTAAAEARPKT